jgi:hypothetical protein
MDLIRGEPGSNADFVTTSGTGRLSQLMAQAVVQPGLEDVLEDLLQYEEASTGAEFYMAGCAGLAGAQGWMAAGQARGTAREAPVPKPRDSMIT